MNRRGFIGSLGLGAAGLVAGSEFDWERLLWRPKPIITVPSMPGKGTVRVWMDETCHVFRNVSLLEPKDILISAYDLKHRTLGRVELEADVPLVGGTQRLSGEFGNPNKGLVLHAGNTLTLQFGGPLVRYT